MVAVVEPVNLHLYLYFTFSAGGNVVLANRIIAAPNSTITGKETAWVQPRSSGFGGTAVATSCTRERVLSDRPAW